jgi:hypothetical protein
MNKEIEAVPLIKTEPATFRRQMVEVSSRLRMDGILRNKVDFVLVVRRPYNYYLPPDDQCFTPLVKAYPGPFHLLYENPQFSVFQVLRKTSIHLG